MADIFLSYSSKDAERVQVLRDALTGHGFSVFWDHDVPPGTDWDTWIRKHLAESRCAVVVWTFQSIDSKNVRHEAVVAETQGKLISVLLDSVPSDRFPMGQYTVEGANLSAWSGDLNAKEYVSLVHWLESRLTPAWVKNTLEARDVALEVERNGREAAEAQVRLRKDQNARDTVVRQRLEAERDTARAELVAAQSAAERIQPTRSKLRRVGQYALVAVLCAFTGLIGYQLALRERSGDPPYTTSTDIVPAPPPAEPAAKQEEPEKVLQAADLSVEDSRLAAIDRISRLKRDLDSDTPVNSYPFSRPPPLRDLIERGWGSGPFAGWTLADLDRLCVTHFNGKLGQCNWSTAQQTVLPALAASEIQARSQLASRMLRDLHGRTK
jgi:hypothetical protein